MGAADRSGATDGLLHGVRVLDLSIWRPGPYATQLLADLGADVIKVEPPGGDPIRAFPELFATLNGNKRSVVLNLHEPDDRRARHALVRETDAVVEGFRPASRRGSGWARLRCAPSTPASSTAPCRGTARAGRSRRCRATTSTTRPTPPC